MPRIMMDLLRKEAEKAERQQEIQGLKENPNIENNYKRLEEMAGNPMVGEGYNLTEFLPEEFFLEAIDEMGGEKGALSERELNQIKVDANREEIRQEADKMPENPYIIYNYSKLEEMAEKRGYELDNRVGQDEIKKMLEEKGGDKGRLSDAELKNVLAVTDRMGLDRYLGELPNPSEGMPRFGLDGLAAREKAVTEKATSTENRESSVNQKKQKTASRDEGR